MLVSNCKSSTIFEDGEFIEARRGGGYRVCLSTAKSHVVSVDAILITEFAMIQVVAHAENDTVENALAFMGQTLTLCYIESTLGIINASKEDIDILIDILEDLIEYTLK